MRGKAQTDGCQAVEFIEMLVLLFSICGQKYMCNAGF